MTLVVVRTTTGRETFRVTSVRLIRKQALPLRALFDRDGGQRLRIGFRSQGGYDDNLVLTASHTGARLRSGRRLGRRPVRFSG
jgi:hypothetical protein